MARFRIGNIADLARQMTFTPQQARSAQLTAAEELLHSLDPLKAYPLEYVIYRITSYHPKTVGQDLLTGLALQHDLGQLIENVSNSLDLRVDQFREPVLQIEDVCERFNVTSKTIQRWRRKGLAARRFIFADGKRRVGFMLSSVERFLSTHQDQVSRGSNFSQLTTAERDEILRRSMKLATACGCCLHEISRRVARRVKRSPLTVQHIVKKHDAENPGRAILANATTPLSDDERVRIVRGYRRGLAIRDLSRRVCRQRSAVYRVLIDERLEKLNRRKTKFIDDPLYHQPDAEAVVGQIASAELLEAPADREANRVPKDLPPYLAELYRTALLSPAKERALFLKFNFHKWQFVSARRQVEPQSIRVRDLNRMEGFWRKAVDTKNAIVRANLRLVVSIARKHLRPGLSLMELVSDGNITLMRAVESFDTHRGNRFSTYASLALMKGFARSVPLMLAARSLQPASDAVLTEVADPRIAETHRMADREHVRSLLQLLDPREREVLLAHYGLQDGERSEPPTLDHVGRRLGLSKQRVRQIEQQALAKLRTAMGVSSAN